VSPLQDRLVQLMCSSMAAAAAVPSTHRCLRLPQGRFKQEVAIPEPHVRASEFERALQLPAAGLFTRAASWLVQRMGLGGQAGRCGPAALHPGSTHRRCTGTLSHEAMHATCPPTAKALQQQADRHQQQTA